MAYFALLTLRIVSNGKNKSQGQKVQKGKNIMNLKQIRQLQGLTIREMANKLNVGENYLYKIEAGIRPMSKNLRLQLELMAKERENQEPKIMDNCQKLVYNPVQPPPNQPSVTSPPPLESQAPAPESEPGSDTMQPDGGTLVVAPVEVLTTVEENNKLLTGIDDTITGLDNTLTEVAKSLKVLEGFDAAVQRRVREVIEERSQHIIAMCNLHVTSQSQIIIAALTAVITVLEAGSAPASVAVTLLERLRDQIANLPKVTRETI